MVLVYADLRHLPYYSKGRPPILLVISRAGSGYVYLLFHPYLTVFLLALMEGGDKNLIHLLYLLLCTRGSLVHAEEAPSHLCPILSTWLTWHLFAPTILRRIS